MSVSTKTSVLAISYSEIISALSFAIDLTEGAVQGHALRTCLLGMRLAEHVGVPRRKMQALYYALLLKDIGCSSNAARLCQIIGGDERAFKHMVKRDDWRTPYRSRRKMMGALWTQVMPEASALRRGARIVRIGLFRKKNNNDLYALRCDRGALIAQKLGLSEETATAIHALDEHWDGTGYPLQRMGKGIPALARILAVAQHLDAFASEDGREVAMAVLLQRSGTWFDPAVVAAVVQMHAANTLWTGCCASDPHDVLRRAVLASEPTIGSGVGEDEIDAICEAFADVVDAKSPFTYRHSIGVANVSVMIARRLGLPPERVQLVRRAALLHDLGKLSVPNTILDKPGRLTENEHKIVAEHARLTRRILARIESFAELARIAGAHHERLDGSGYPDHLHSEELTIEARIIAVADTYSAMTEERPYRKAMTEEQAMDQLNGMIPQKLDARCVVALAEELRPMRAA
jgi:putative nucleotidyltransferase with HDIG domain